MEKIVVYKRKRCTGSRKVEKFFKDNNIDYIEINIDKESILRSDMMQIIESTENGFEDVLKTTKDLDEEKVEELNFQDFLSFLVGDVENQKHIKSPIIKQGDKIVIGAKENELTSFLPREKEKGMFRSYLLKAKEELAG